MLAERDALWSAGKLEQPMFEPAWQFAAADKLVIAAPFWDMSFPAILKIYLERISVTDLTFGYSRGGGHGGAVPGLQAALYHHPGAATTPAPPWRRPPPC